VTLREPILCRLKVAKTPENYPKTPQKSYPQALAPILFYKFYKFRGFLHIKINGMRAYRGHMGTENGHMGTENGHMGTETSIYKGLFVPLKCPHDKNHKNRCRSRL
jgi:hypothetical protein